MPDLQVGESLMSTSLKVSEIQVVLQDAVDAAVAADSMVNAQEIYKGAAEAELSIFYSQYALNVQKLTYYYSLALQYLKKVVEVMEFTDDEMALLAVQLVNSMPEGDGSWQS